MRHVRKVLVLILAFILDSTLGTYIGIWNISPSLLLVTVIAMAVAGEMAEAGVYGLFAGALWDLFWGRTFGFYALIYMFTAILACAFLELIYKNTPLITAGITLVASLLCEALLCFFTFTIWGEGNFMYALFRSMIPTAVYTAVCQLLFYHPIVKLSRPKKERGVRL